MHVRGTILLIAALATGCSEMRYHCEACLQDDAGVCAKSTGVAVRHEEDARCAAAEAVCAELNPERFAKICKGRKHSVMFGCSKEVIAEMRFDCTATTHVRVPLLMNL